VPVWRPAGSYSQDSRLPGVVRSKPHGQTVWELRTFDVPYNAFSHTLSTASRCVQQPVSSCVRSPPRRCRRSLIKRSHSAGGCRMQPASRNVALHSSDCACFTERRCRARHLAMPRLDTCHSPQAATGGSPRQAERSAAPLSSPCVGTLCSRRCRPVRALYQRASLSTDSIQLLLQRDVRIRYVLSILTKMPIRRSDPRRSRITAEAETGRSLCASVNRLPMLRPKPLICAVASSPASGRMS
jgi:hypothetical protein